MYCRINKNAKKVKILRYFGNRGIITLMDNGRQIRDINYATFHDIGSSTVLLYSGSAYGEQGEQLLFREFLKRCIAK